MVDYHTELLSSGLNFFSKDEDDEEDADIKFFKLHGNMNQNERTEVFKTFRKSHSGVLLCTVRNPLPGTWLSFREETDVTQYPGSCYIRGKAT